MYNYYANTPGVEMLRKSQFDLFNQYVDHLYSEDADTGLQAVLNFLQEVFGLFHAQDTASANLNNVLQGNVINRNKYKQIRFIISLLGKLEKQDAVKLAQAFQQAYQNHCSKFTVVKLRKEETLNALDEEEKEENASADPAFPNEVEEERVSLSKFSSQVSYLFTSGLFSNLTERYNDLVKQYPYQMIQVTPSMKHNIAKAMDNAKLGDLYEFIKEALPLIGRLEEEAAKVAASLKKIQADKAEGTEHETSGTKEFIAGSTALSAALRACVNQAILLLDQKNDVPDGEVSRKGKEKDGADAAGLPNKNLIIQINGAFVSHIEALMNALFEQDLENTPPTFDITATTYLADVYRFCKQRESNPEAKRISQEILDYYNPHAAAPFIINPIFVLGQKYISGDSYYQNLLRALKEEFNNNASSIPNSGEQILKSYLSTRGGFLNWVRDTYKNKSPSHAESKAYRKGVAKNIKHRYKNFGAQQEAIDINDLGGLLYSCNVSIYGKRGDAAEKGYKANRYAGAEPHTIKGRSSKLKKAVSHSIARIRRLVNKNRQQIDCLLADGSGITKHDFYYELTLSVNKGIKADTKATYNGNVNPFWKKPLEWLTLSSSKIKQERKEKLNQLMNGLTNCKTEDSYVAFLYQALNLLLESSGKNVEHHVYDYHYKTAIVNACREVVRRHILRGNKFGLDFNLEQLLLVEKILRALHLRDDPVYQQLTALITQKEDSEKDRLNENKVNISEVIEGQLVQQSGQAYEKNKQRKINSFKTALLAKLESSILADIVISTGRFVLKDKDIGLIGQGLSLILANANLPGAAAAGAVIRTVSHTLDDAIQQQQGQAVSSQVASYKGAFSLWWNDIVLVAVNRLADMFADELGRMQSPEDASQFAEFCYARIYAAIKHIDSSTMADLDMADYLIASVFTGNQKLNWMPGRKDHYRRTGDTSYFPATTFQGLVDNVGFKCENTKEIQEKDQATQATKDIYLNMKSLKVYGSKDRTRSKLAKYGFCNGSAAVAIKVGRYKLTTEQDVKYVAGKNIEKRLAGTMHLVYGKKQEQAETQEALIAENITPVVKLK